MIALCKENGYPYEQYEHLFLKLERELQGSSSLETNNIQNTENESSSINRKQGFFDSAHVKEDVPEKQLCEDEKTRTDDDDDDDDDVFSDCDVNELLT